MRRAQSTDRKSGRSDLTSRKRKDFSGRVVQPRQSDEHAGEEPERFGQRPADEDVEVHVDREADERRSEPEADGRYEDIRRTASAPGAAEAHEQEGKEREQRSDPRLGGDEQVL